MEVASSIAIFSAMCKSRGGESHISNYSATVISSVEDLSDAHREIPSTTVEDLKEIEREKV